MGASNRDAYAEPGPLTKLPDIDGLRLDEAWRAARAGEVDPDRFGILDMWGLPFIGNVILDLACLNKVEMLPWDGWGMVTGPFDPVSDEAAAVFDEVAQPLT